MIIRADSEHPERNLHFTPPSSELMDAANMVADTIFATTFYATDGTQALVYAGGGYLVNVWEDDNGIIHTSSRVDGGEWETGWDA